MVSHRKSKILFCTSKLVLSHVEGEVDQLLQTELDGACNLTHWALISSQLPKDLLNTMCKQGVMPSAGGKQINEQATIPAFEGLPVYWGGR